MSPIHKKVHDKSLSQVLKNNTRHIFIIDAKKVRDKYLSLTNIKAHDKYFPLILRKNIWDKYLLLIHKKLRDKYLNNKINLFQIYIKEKEANLKNLCMYSKLNHLL